MEVLLKKSTATFIGGVSMGATCALILVAGGVGAAFSHGSLAFVSVERFEARVPIHSLADHANCAVTKYVTGQNHTIVVDGRTPHWTYTGGYMFNEVRMGERFYAGVKMDWGQVVSPPGGTSDDRNRVVANACRQGAMDRGLTTVSFHRERE